MITDDMIRDALHRIADAAPSGARVHAALAHRSRWRRHRRALLLAGGATAAVGAIAGPAVLVMRERQPIRIEAGTGNLSEPAPPPAPAGDNTLVPLRWRPTWLPEEYVEVSRTVTLAGATGLQVRSWRRSGSRAGGHHADEELIHLHAAPPAWFGDQSWRRPATVNGAPGGIARHPAQVSQVVWQPNPAELLAVGVTGARPDAIEIAERIAGSVVADEVAGCELPLELGWLPAGLAGDQVATVDTDGTGDPRVELRLLPAGSAMGATPTVLAMLGTSVSRPADGEPVEVRGGDGTGLAVQHASATTGWVHVGLEDGRELVVSLVVEGQAEPAAVLNDVVRLADSVRIGPVPDTSWLGRR